MGKDHRKTQANRKWRKCCDNCVRSTKRDDDKTKRSRVKIAGRVGGNRKVSQVGCDARHG